jgi:opacity protein-like surface antigen
MVRIRIKDCNEDLRSNICREDCLKPFAVLNLCLAVLLCSTVGLDAQDATQPAQTPAQPTAASKSGTSSSSTSTADINESGRRLTAGFTLSVLGFTAIPDKSSTVTNSSTLSTQYQTTGESSRIGYGAIIQYRLTNHFSVDVGATYRRIGYQLTTTTTQTTTSILNGISTSTTSTTQVHEDTRSHLIDIPFVLRFYSSAKRPNGPRWFLEGGGAWRVATGIETSTDTTDASGINTCCTTDAAKPAHSSGIGMVGGAGVQLIDPLGIHVVPAVRYTRWINPVFDAFTTSTGQNQLEATISLTF